MPEPKTNWPAKIRFGGLGGQGLVTLGAVLAEAGAEAGMNVAASQSYGSQARGGATRSDVILSKEEIDFPHVHKPDFLVVLSQEAYDLYVNELTEEGIVFLDDFFVKATDFPFRQITVSGTKTAAEQIGNKLAANFVMLGALLGYTRLVDSPAVIVALKNLVHPRFQKVNTQAFELGFALGAELGKAEN